MGSRDEGGEGRHCMRLVKGHFELEDHLIEELHGGGDLAEDLVGHN